MAAHTPPKIDHTGKKWIKFNHFSHLPYDILSVVKQFTNSEDIFQMKLRTAFVNLYKSAALKDRSKPNLEVGGFGGLSEDESLRSAMEFLLPYFFGKSMHADLQFEDDIFAEDHIGYGLHAETGATLGCAKITDSGRAIIYIDSSLKRHPTMVSLLETLVHELAHTVYDSFTCDCKSCERTNRSSKIIGRLGHGKLWVKMMEHMRDTIRSWDRDLATFMDNGDIEWQHMNRC